MNSVNKYPQTPDMNPFIKGRYLLSTSVSQKLHEPVILYIISVIYGFRYAGNILGARPGYCMLCFFILNALPQAGLVGR